MVRVFFCGTTRIRTGDTRIFSPMLYQLSYGTNIVGSCNAFLLASAKVGLFLILTKLFLTFFALGMKKGWKHGENPFMPSR